MGFFNPIKFISDAVNTVVHGAEEGANAVAGVVSTAANTAAGAANTAANTAAGVVTAVGQPVVDIVEDASRAAILLGRPVVDMVEDASQATGAFLADEGNRAWSVAGDMLAAGRDNFRGAIRDFEHGAHQLGKGVGELASGNVAAGLKDIGVGAFRGLSQSVIGLELNTLREQIDAIQTLTHLEQPSRGLNAGEIAELRKVFGDTVDYSQVRIKEGSAGVFSVNDRAFTVDNTIYMKSDPSSGRWTETLVHEMTHIWQFQHGGTAYVVESLVGQATAGQGAYDWRKGKAEGKEWSALNPEQQAALIQDAYNHNMFNSPTDRFMDASGDHTDYVRRAIAQLQAGIGAP
jgi:hypothetical protein